MAWRLAKDNLTHWLISTQGRTPVRPRPDRERRLLAVEEIRGVRVVRYLQDTPTGRKVEPRRQERNQCWLRGPLHRVNVMFKRRRPPDRDPPSSANGHLPRRQHGHIYIRLVINLPACFTYTFLINILPALRVLRRRIGRRVRRDDGPWIIDALEHVDGDDVPAARKVRVAVERNNIRLVLI